MNDRSERRSEAQYTAAAVAAVRDAVAGEDDFAGWLAGVLATVAAGLGSTAALFAGRDGSWEAAHLRGLVSGTVGPDDEHLGSFR
jgi:hypothetical protein